MKPTLLMRSFLLPLLLLASCHSNSNDGNNAVTEPQISQQIAAVNTELVISDKELIERYFQKREWPIQSTGSGLVYHIFKRSSGAKATKETKVHISFTVSLLDGTVCYGADKPVEKELVVGMGKETSGLEEVLLLLKEGDSAIIAVPPHLGYGLLGDEDKIPPRSTIIYDLTIVKVLQNN